LSHGSVRHSVTVPVELSRWEKETTASNKAGRMTCPRKTVAGRYV